MKKSIWFISKYASPPHSHGGQRGISLAKEFVKAGHHAAVITSSSNHFGIFKKNQWVRIENGFCKASFDGVTMMAHASSTYRRTASARRILSWVHFEWGLLRLPTRHLAEPTHIIVSSLSLLTILNGYRLAREFDAKLVFEIRDIWPLTLQAELGLSDGNPFVWFLSVIEKFGYRISDVIVGTMPNLQEHVQSVTGKKTRVETVPMGIDEDLMKLVPRYVPPPRSQSRTIVGYSGSVGRANSLNVLLEAATLLGPNRNIEFHFWGGGDLLESYRQIHREQSHIRFHGHVERRVLFQEVSKSHLLFLAANDSLRWNYGQSLNKMLEYMMVGRPIIAAFSGYQSMLTEAKCGVYVPAQDSKALVETLLDFCSLPRKELARLGLNGRRWVVSTRRYSHLSSEYLRILDSL